MQMATRYSIKYNYTYTYGNYIFMAYIVYDSELYDIIVNQNTMKWPTKCPNLFNMGHTWLCIQVQSIHVHTFNSYLSYIYYWCDGNSLHDKDVMMQFSLKFKWNLHNLHENNSAFLLYFHWYFIISYLSNFAWIILINVTVFTKCRRLTKCTHLKLTPK